MVHWDNTLATFGGDALWAPVSAGIIRADGAVLMVPPKAVAAATDVSLTSAKVSAMHCWDVLSCSFTDHMSPTQSERFEERGSAESVFRVSVSPVFKVGCAGGKKPFSRPVQLQLPHSSATIDGLKVCCLRRVILCQVRHSIAFSACR